MYYSQDRSFQANQLRRVATSEMEESEWEKFFQGNPAPSNLETSEQQLHKFCCQQSTDGR